MAVLRVPWFEEKRRATEAVEEAKEAQVRLTSHTGTLRKAIIELRAIRTRNGFTKQARETMGIYVPDEES